MLFKLLSQFNVNYNFSFRILIQYCASYFLQFLLLLLFKFLYYSFQLLNTQLCTDVSN
jgi:hypothetical protein